MGARPPDEVVLSLGNRDASAQELLELFECLGASWNVVGNGTDESVRDRGQDEPGAHFIKEANWNLLSKRTARPIQHGTQFLCRLSVALSGGTTSPFLHEFDLNRSIYPLSQVRAPSR